MGIGGERGSVGVVEDHVEGLNENWYESKEYGCPNNSQDAIGGFPLFHIGEEVEVEEEGETEESAFEDETVGEVELDDIVSGDGGSGEGGDDDLDHHHYEEEDADGHLRIGYS